MGYISVKTIAEHWGLTKRRVLVLCKENRIPGAQQIGNMWVVPEDAQKPVDGRKTRYYKRKIQSMEIKPLQKSVKAEGHTPQYKMHKYFARRPYNVFSNLVRHYTQKGDVVLDCFCGGGVTVFESAALGRLPIGVDINPLAAFISRMQMFNGEIAELQDFYRRFLLVIEKKYSDWYDLVFDDDSGTAIWIEWAYKVVCPECGAEIPLLEDRKISNGVYACPNEECKCHTTGARRVNCAPAGSVPIRAKYRSNSTGKDTVRKVKIQNIPALSKYNFKQILRKLPHKPDFEIPQNWDRQHEDKLTEKGVVNYGDFFTERNFALNCLIFNEILELRAKAPSLLNEYLYFLFSSSLRYTNKMTRVTENWEGGKPTAMDKHAFWLPNQYVETNIIDVLTQRSKAIIKGCEYSSGKLPKNIFEVSSFEDIKLHSGYMVLNQSSSALPLPAESVDAIITDPPYGSNVQYAELSTIWNAWFAIYSGLDNFIYKDEEAVVNRKSNFKGAKNEDDYEELLYMVYSEGARVLKKDGFLVFTFNNKNIKVWMAMLKAVARSGFYLPDDGILFQDYIESYKNTAHLRFAGNIQGDFIYSFKKGTPETTFDCSKGFFAIIDESISKTITMTFKRRKTCSTPELYQKLLTNITKGLMEYILWSIKNDHPIEDVSDIPNDYLENQLKQKLSYNSGDWKKEQ